jgi:magnesium transporter
MIDLIQYSSNSHQVFHRFSPQAAKKIVEDAEANQDKKNPIVNWLDIAIKKEDTMAEVARLFNLHALVLEDINNHNHLPKYEQYENYVFITLKMLSIQKDEDGEEFVEDEQISIILGEGWLITIQETEGDVFDHVRHRIKEALGNLRHRKADYLFYRLIDVVVDNYYLVLESMRDKIENLEELLVDSPESNYNDRILHLKKQLRTFRRYMLPLKNEVNRIRVEPAHFFQKFTMTYLSDVHDHLVALDSSFETFREMLNDLTDLHLAYLSHSMNKVMKTLSTVSTIFIPLTFVAGIYGMNFHHMPELEWVWSYPILMLSMVLISLVLVIFMRRKGWF